MGWLDDSEVRPAWRAWLDELAGDGRAQRDGARWFAAEAPREPLAAWRGRLEAVIPIFCDVDAEGTRSRGHRDARALRRP
jgi:hypothetical protein